MLAYDGPVIVDCMVEKEENCFPMIPSGAAHNDMILALKMRPARPYLMKVKFWSDTGHGRALAHKLFP